LSMTEARLQNVYIMRTSADVDRGHHAIDQAKHEGQRHDAGRGRAAVIGAGALGVEVAASLTQCGLAVDLIVRGGWPWHKFAGEVTGKLLTRFFERHGATIHLNAALEKLEGDGRVQRAILADGQSISCDFAVAAVGMVVNRE